MKILGFIFRKDKSTQIKDILANKIKIPGRDALIDKKAFESFIIEMDEEHKIESIECTMDYLSEMLSIKIDDVEKFVNKDTTEDKATGLKLIEMMKRSKDAFDTERKLMMDDTKDKLNVRRYKDNVPYIG